MYIKQKLKIKRYELSNHSTISQNPKVVIVGAGFGGLWAARTLARQPVDVTVIDHNNYHTFLPLLYQVASAQLSPEDIAYPVRSLFWNVANIDFVKAHARRLDLQNRLIETDDKSVAFDYLILAAGSVSSTFDLPGVQQYACFLKTLEEAVVLRNRIISCFEAASGETDPVKRKSLLTFVIVGGGATGVEYAGALAELIAGSIAKDYPGLDFSEVQIILLEAADELVSAMPPDIRDYTARQLRRMGVQVQLNAAVAEVLSDRVILKGANDINTNTVIWMAGVRGEALAAASAFPLTQDKRVQVQDTLQLPDHSNIYIIGDLAAIREDQRTLPMVAQVAIQSGITSAKNILRQIAGTPPVPFHYVDLGSTIAIGRKAAGIAIGKWTFHGLLAWIMWLMIHLIKLIGFRNRMMVLINWAWDYLFYEQAVRYVFPAMTGSKQSPPRIRKPAD